MRERRRPDVRFGDADEVEKFDGPQRRLLLGEVLVGADRLGYLLADPVDGGEGGQRVLEDHRDPGAAHGVEGRLGGADQLRTVEPDRAAYGRRVRQQAEDGERRDGLARARLADDAEDFTALQLEADTAYGGAAGEVDREVAYFENGRHERASPEVGSNASRSASPMRLTARTNTTSRPAAKKNIHG